MKMRQHRKRQARASFLWMGSRVCFSGSLEEALDYLRRLPADMGQLRPVLAEGARLFAAQARSVCHGPR